MWIRVELQQNVSAVRTSRDPTGQPESYPLVNLQKAMENGPIEIVDFPMKNDHFHSYVSSPEGIQIGYGNPQQP